jgi:hypothetical protein
MTVSPGSTHEVRTISDRCPTFSWGRVEGADSYELSVHRLDPSVPRVDPLGDRLDPDAWLDLDERAEPQELLRLHLAGAAQSWTPDLERCLEPGALYGWSIRTQHADGPSSWAPPAYLQVSAAPTLAEVESALAVLRRYRDERRQLAGPASGIEPADAPQLEGVPSQPTGISRALLRRAPAGSGAGSRALSSPTAGARRLGSSAAPAIGTASLSVSEQVHLADASAVFKGGDLFLWDEVLSVYGFDRVSTALGRGALASNTAGAGTPLSGTDNTAMGHLALNANTIGYHNTAVGSAALAYNTEGILNTAVGFGSLRLNTVGELNVAVGVNALERNTESLNTAVGASAMSGNTTGFWNVAVGASALLTNETGQANTAIGLSALQNGTTGSRNTAIGFFAGLQTRNGSDNILLNHQGVDGESNTLRIGQASGTENYQLDRAYIQGISGRTVTGGDAVFVDADGQLGTMTSSARFKEDVRELDAVADRLMRLRPVSFRYREEIAGDEDPPLEYGLIAEEVAEVFPELVHVDEDGKPFAVRYHLLSTLLLEAFQEQQRTAAATQMCEPPHDERARLSKGTRRNRGRGER